MNPIKELAYLGLNKRISERHALQLIAKWLDEIEKSETLGFEYFKQYNNIKEQ